MAKPVTPYTHIAKPATAYSEVSKNPTAYTVNPGAVAGITAGSLAITAGSLTVQATGYTSYPPPNQTSNKPSTAYTDV